MNFMWIILGASFLIILYLWSLYNGLVTSRMRIKEAWSGIDVQLKRRADLIPNLVETVKGYAKHEKEVFERVTKARAALLSATTPQAKGKANRGLTAALKTLFAVAEDYPNLKASENFRDLQRQLEDTEDNIAYARLFYNSNVLDYNTKIKIFPNVLLAQKFGFKEEEFFEAEESEKKKTEVKFE